MTEAAATTRHSRFRICATHPALEGHFPGRPLVPGVVVLDEVQLALAAAWPGTVVRSWPQVKFLTPLLPEEWAMITLTMTEPGRFDFRVDREGTVIASGKVQA